MRGGLSAGLWVLAAGLIPLSAAWGQPVAPRSVASDPPFRGMIDLAVDATDTDHAIIAAQETIPVQKAGDFVLLYPEWETASHAPTVPLAALTGLVVRIDGRRVEWRRDTFDPHVFHVPVPEGAARISLGFSYIADRASFRDAMLTVPWQRLLLYPAGWAVDAIPVQATLRLPADKTVFTALDRAAPDQPGVLRFAPTTLDRLADAPVLAARISRRIDLAPGATRPVWLDVVADDPANLAITDDELAGLRIMVRQAAHVFGPPPFRHYDAFVVLDDAQGAGGTEHLEEGENSLPARYFLEPSAQLMNRDLIAHELIHAWNGRFRQPDDLYRPTYNQPVGGSLLWVYEGQTEFWARVLAARSGQRSRQDTLDRLALDAASVASRPGRAWKSLADSGNDAIYMAGRRVAWRDWQRREDYYSEGVLLWLDVDARLRELSRGRRALDDFAAPFFRVTRPDGKVSPYDFAEICRVLAEVAPDDWPAFLHRHLDTHDDGEAMAGLRRAGWRLIYTSEPTETFRQNEAEGGGLDLTYSIGAVIDDDGRIATVAWDSPAFRAGLAPGLRIMAIAGAPYAREALRLAVAATPRQPLSMELAGGARRTTVTVAYRGGLRYPRIEPIPGQPDRLTPLLTPR